MAQVEFFVSVPRDALEDMNEIMNGGAKLTAITASGVISEILSNSFTEYLGESVTVPVTVRA
jgi:hypothetical protein